MVVEPEWYGLYKEKWGARIVPSAVAHPAKIAYGLTVAIYDFMMAQGWLRQNDWVLDVFGGQAGTGFEALARGMNYIAIEIEPRFFEMSAEEYPCPGFDVDFWRRYQKRPAHVQRLRAERRLCPECEAAMKPKTKLKKGTRLVIQRRVKYREAHVYRGNLPFWQWKYGKVLPNWGQWVFVRGDSRFLRQVLAGQVDGSLISSPYGVRMVHGQPGIDPSKFAEQDKTGEGSEAFVMERYGEESGNLDRLPMGAAFVSTPYGDSTVVDPHIQLAEAHGLLTANEGDGQTYGRTEGQLANMPPDAVFVSPPYADSVNQSAQANDSGARLERKAAAGVDVSRAQNVGGPNSVLNRPQTYGKEEGQLGAMPSGDIQAALTSSPYAGMKVTKNSGTIDLEKQYQSYQAAGGGASFEAFVATQEKHSSEYGTTLGQLSVLREGEIDAAAFSSPYFETRIDGRGDEGSSGLRMADGSYVRGSEGWEARKAMGARYGGEGGNLGNMAPGDDPDTFWGATRLILAELYAVLKPGGVLASVTGDYIRDYKRVPFGRQWCAAAEAAGFVLVAHAKAWKVKEHPGTVDMFGEETPGKKVQHLGMFRKMANAKNVERNPDDPDAAIESEDVWFLQKPVEVSR